MRHKPKPEPKTEPKQTRVRGPTVFRKTEITRAIAGVKDAGLEPNGVEIDPRSGRIRVLFGASAEGAPLDTWLRKKDARPA